MKVVFVTDCAFFEHRQELLIGLNKHCNLLLILFFEEGFKNFTYYDILKFGTNNNIELKIIKKGKFRARNPQRIIYDFNNLILPIIIAKPDVCYFESFGSPYSALMITLFLWRIKKIMAIHDFALHEVKAGKTPLSARIYQRISIFGFSNFHFFSYSQQKLFQNKYPKKQSYVIRLFLVGASDSVCLKKETNEKTNFLYFGRIFYYKGVDILIKAAEILGDRRNDFLVTIAGNLKDKNEIFSLIHNESLFDLRIKFIRKDEIPKLFSNADFFVAPYREVTQSGPLMMAYNNNLIPIVSNNPGFIEYVDDKINGFVFDNESSESLADVMEMVLKMNKHESQIVHRNLLIFKKKEFEINTLVKKYIDMFNDIV